MNSFHVLKKEVVFSDEETNIMKFAHLDLTDAFLTVILNSAGIESFDPDLDEDDIHDICIEAIKEYADIVFMTARVIENECNKWHDLVDINIET